MQSNLPVIKNVLTIAGSDSGGGAGIQADIKAISATNSYACSVITALTAQNTLGVNAVLPIDAEFVAAQLDAVFTDIKISAVKIGMLADSKIIKVIASKLKQYQPQYIVLDPVMVATSGDPLIDKDAIITLKEQLLPIADLITPNLAEAAILIENQIPNQTNFNAFLDKITTLNTNAILVKGGHMSESENCNDYLFYANNWQCFNGTRIATNNTHGTGCTLSAAIASYLAQGNSMSDAITLAKNYISQALANADKLKVGQGHGPVNHFYHLNRR